MPKRLSFQLYSARNFPPLRDTLALLARIGYREVEGFGGVFDKPEALRRLLDRNGLSMPTAHVGLDMLEAERPRVLEVARALGIRHLYAPYLADDQRPRTAAGWRRLGKRLATIGEWVRSEGFGFGWHNHDFEFVKLETGEIPLDILFEAAPALDWECDLAWVARAKANPLSWIRRHGHRITAVHVKDIAPRGACADEDGWADVGQGTIAWAPIFSALTKTRTMHFVIEHDNPGDLERFARRSFQFASGM